MDKNLLDPEICDRLEQAALTVTSILNSAGQDEAAVKYFLDRLAHHMNEALARKREEKPTIQ